MIKFEGIMPALVTPLNSDETLNAQALKKLIEYLLSQGADGFYVGGATGEGISLCREVREMLAYESVNIVGGRKPCIVHIAATDLNEAIALAKQAEAIGAAAISAIPPLFFKYSENDVHNYYKKIAENVHIPLMVYYNPAAGFNMNANFAAKLFEIDNITAIKWTSPDYFGMMRLKDITHGEMNVINGPDEMLLMGLSAGADGGIGTTYNFQQPTIKKIYDSFMAGDMKNARIAQHKANRVIETLLKYPVIPATKAILCAQGFNVGEAAYPMARFTEEETKKIIAEMKSAGLEID